ncbi:MAG: DUF2079 domain-containing protein [bacterium]|nr:DUF2079 domain-containing protein [bacterium]
MTSLHAYRAIVVAVILYIIIFGVVTALRHYNFQTQTWDMGVFDQLFWNTIHGRIMQGSIEEIPDHFGVHWSPGLLLLVPGYALFPSPYYLLFIQVLALAAGALPLYRLAMRMLQRESLAKLITVAYLLYPSLHWLNLFDFHEIAFFVPALLAALYYADAERWGWASFWFAIAASMKEDAIIAVAFAGLYFLIRRKDATFAWWNRNRLYAAFIALGALLYIVLAVKVFMPAFGGGLLRLDRYAALGSSVGEIVTNLVRNPTLFARTILTLPKMDYLLWLFAPLAFLPLFSGRAFLLIVPGLLENLLTTNRFQFSTFYQYDAILIPGMFFCAVYGLRNVVRRWPAWERFARRALVIAVAIGFFVRSPVNPFTFPFNLFGTNSRWQIFRELSRDIPENLSVTAQTNLLPHLAHREKIYQLGMERAFADVAFIDINDPFGFGDNTDAFAAYAKQYIENPAYDVTAYNDRYVVARKKP